MAICRYFEGLQPEPPLFGVEPLEQATIEMWNRRAEINLLLPGAQAFRNLTGFFKDREKVSKEWGAISLEATADALTRFNDVLADRQYLAGDAFSIADITLGVGLVFLKQIKLDLPFDAPNVARYLEQLGGRPSFQEG